MSTGIFHKKILYVCPAKPVAFQVGANFVKMGYKVHYLVENMGHLSYDSNCNIFVGTPNIIEKYLPKIYTNFDYAVFDEIHNLENNIYYENIIKLVDCSFLALSATIENIDFLKDIFHKIHSNKKIEYVEYNKRFINIQRWIYNDKLEKVHPITCLDINDINSIKDISFTPYDCISLYEELEDEYDDIEYLSPDNYFKDDKLLTLDDTREYEKFIKNELSKLLLDDKTKIEKIVNNMKRDVNKSDTLDNIVSLFTDCKKNDLLPMIYFHTDEKISKEIFDKIYELLKDEERLNYPYHYDILKNKNDLYKKYLLQREIYSSNIKIKSNDAKNEKYDKLNEYDKTEREKYIMTMSNIYKKYISKCKNSENKTSYINLKREYKEFLENPDFREIDIFKKHSDYTYSRGDPMSGNEIRSIRREIRNTLGLTISYESAIIQLLKRGIGLYISSMPDEYNWILQKLMSERKLGIIISDKTLCLGIDLPIRSVCLSGYNNPNYTNSDYLQMSGRAGRRGHDNMGNIIFHGLSNYLNCMKGTLPILKGSNKKIGNSYLCLEDLNKNIKLDNLSWRINNSNDNLLKENVPVKILKVAWNLRYKKDIISFLDEINKIEKKIFRKDENEREIWFLELIINNITNYDNKLILDIYKSNKINNNIIDTIKIIYDINDLIKDIINSLDNSYMITKRVGIIIFNNLKEIIYRHRGFE
tara:strand:- start:1389 stop:3494 length:2106 start_codon:yes stop_codon:yes gene_type:complete